MGAVCRGLCETYKAESVSGTERYRIGQKRCSLCNHYFLTDDDRCPCCKTKLRTKPRNKRSWNQL